MQENLVVFLSYLTLHSEGRRWREGGRGDTKEYDCLLLERVSSNETRSNISVEGCMSQNKHAAVSWKFSFIWSGAITRDTVQALTLAILYIQSSLHRIVCCGEHHASPHVPCVSHLSNLNDLFPLSLRLIPRPWPSIWILVLTEWKCHYQKWQRTMSPKCPHK